MPNSGPASQLPQVLQVKKHPLAKILDLGLTSLIHLDEVLPWSLWSLRMPTQSPRTHRMAVDAS